MRSAALARAGGGGGGASGRKKDDIGGGGRKDDGGFWRDEAGDQTRAAVERVGGRLEKVVKEGERGRESCEKGIAGVEREIERVERVLVGVVKEEGRKFKEVLAATKNKNEEEIRTVRETVEEIAVEVGRISEDLREGKKVQENLLAILKDIQMAGVVGMDALGGGREYKADGYGGKDREEGVAQEEDAWRVKAVENKESLIRSPIPSLSLDLGGGDLASQAVGNQRRIPKQNQTPPPWDSEPEHRLPVARGRCLDDDLKIGVEQESVGEPSTAVVATFGQSRRAEYESQLFEQVNDDEDDDVFNDNNLSHADKTQHPSGSDDEDNLAPWEVASEEKASAEAEAGFDPLSAGGSPVVRSSGFKSVPARVFSRGLASPPPLQPRLANSLHGGFRAGGQRDTKRRRVSKYV